MDERAVGVVRLPGEQRLHVAELGRRAEDVAHGVERAALGLHEVLLELLLGDQLDRAGGGEVAELREVRSLVQLDAVDHLGDQKVRIRVALAVRVRDHVDRHVVGVDGDVGAVVGVEAAEQPLRRLPAALVLAPTSSPGTLLSTCVTVRCGRIVKSFARSSRDDAAETGRCASTTSSWRRVSLGLDVAGSLASCAGSGSLASGGRVSSAARVPATIDNETTAATSAASRDPWRSVRCGGGASAWRPSATTTAATRGLDATADEPRPHAGRGVARRPRGLNRIERRRCAASVADAPTRAQWSWWW